MDTTETLVGYVVLRLAGFARAGIADAPAATTWLDRALVRRQVRRLVPQLPAVLV